MKSSRANNKAIRLGLTGGIGCGKSTVGKILEEIGLVRLDTDQLARDLVKPGQPALAEIENVFGATVIGPDGQLDRDNLAALAFSSPDKKRQLETILHPPIWQKVEEFLNFNQRQNRHCLVEVPLLYENSRQDHFDLVWVVASSGKLQEERLQARNQWSKEEIEKRLAQQLPIATKIGLADQVIVNDQGIEELSKNVRLAWNETLKKVNEVR